MAIKTLTMPSDGEIQEFVCNRKMRASEIIELPTGQKFITIVLKLAPAVMQANYPALKNAIKDIQGIQDVLPLIDGETFSEIAENRKLNLVVDVQVRIDKVVIEGP